MKYNESSFYCLKCGQRGIPVVRPGARLRASGHYKKLWCCHCKEELNHYECLFPQDYEDFKEKFDAGEFTEKEMYYNA